MKNEKEKSPSTLTMLLLLLILVSAGVIILKDKNQIEELKQKQAALSENLEVRDSLINDMLTTFGKVEQNLTFLRENHGEMIPVNYGKGRSRQDMLIADVVLMNRILETNSRKLDKLNQLYSVSDFENELLKNEIEQLNKLVETYKINIQQLKTQTDKPDSEYTQADFHDVHFKSDTK
jgi:hypothetical protein